MKENIIRYDFQIGRVDRRVKNKHNSFLIWYTGLSGSGKSTIANLVEQELFKLDVKTYILDGDNIRKGINNDLTFSPEDRSENIRRIGEIANLMVDAGLVVLAAFVSPYKKDREKVRNVVKDINFMEIFIKTSLEECERRDVKGLYSKAKIGKINDMTGISAPYEVPENFDIEIDTEKLTIEQSVQQIIAFIKPKLKLDQ